MIYLTQLGRLVVYRERAKAGFMGSTLVIFLAGLSRLDERNNFCFMRRGGSESVGYSLCYRYFHLSETIPDVCYVIAVVVTKFS